MKEIRVNEVDVTHYRLRELTKLADLAEPFYIWVEKVAQKITGLQNISLNEILMSVPDSDLRRIFEKCYNFKGSKPAIFDGIGRTYEHKKGCWFFFSWLIRDAPNQRLSRLTARMRKIKKLDKTTSEIDTLVALFIEYRDDVTSFEWNAIREVIIDRLEGSRRAAKGNLIEAFGRTALLEAFQEYYSEYGNYGIYNSFEIAPKQIKIGNHTVDVSAKVSSEKGKEWKILMPMKTRETEGGGHSHLFTRDLISAISDLRKIEKNISIIVFIIAQNWSPNELSVIDDEIDLLIHFDMNPVAFRSLDSKTQQRLNALIFEVLSDA